MSVTLLLLISVAIGVGSKVFSKLCSNLMLQNSAAKYFAFLIVNSLVACAFFFASSGFAIFVNLDILLFSLVYAAVVALSIISGFLVYRYVNVSNANVISNTCGMVCTFLLGWILFSEDISFQSVVRLGIMLIAMAVVLVDRTRKSLPNDKKGDLLPLIVVIALMTLCGCANTVVLKAFSQSSCGNDENSFFFFTNVVLLSVAIVGFAISCVKNSKELRESLSILRPKKLIAIVGNTVCSNIGSVVGVLLVAQMEVSVYSSVSSGLGIVVGVVGSLILREKLNRLSYIAAAIACIAILI